MKNLILFVCTLIMIFAGGCGQTGSTGNVSDNSYPVKVDNPQVSAFNTQLGAISDEASAENTVNAFVGYVDSKLDKSASSSTSSFAALIKPETIKGLAMQENINRGASVSDTSNGNKAVLIDIGKITDSINRLGSMEGVKVTDAMITKVRLAVETSLPNINPNGKFLMTPMEASVIGYVAVSGDDGTAKAGSVKIPEDKMNQFVEMLLKGGE